MAAAGQDIGPIPPAKNLHRKAEASTSLRKFADTYFHHRFYLPWSPDHIQVIDRLEEAVLRGGRFALAMPRGSGKTSLCEVACLWAALIGRHPFILLIGSCNDHATEMIQAIKEELQINPLLAEDWPEVCFPISALEDRANRCKGQHTRGKKTRIVWGQEKIVLPTVEGSRASGVAIRVAGITGRIRGAKKESIRPSLVLLDDPQTDASAASESQCEKRQRIISGAVLGLAGPGKKITALCTVTVVRRGDLADRLLDRTQNPEWTGKRFQLVYQFPTNTPLWEKYATLRADEFRNGGDGSQATTFYRQNRADMDAGAVVGWPERFNPDELSAIQHAMNLLHADRESFWAEYQNSPMTEDLGGDQLAAEAVAGRINGLPRCILPLNATKITGFVDVQKKALYWLLVAWREDFSGAVIDYGTWPDQGRRYFTADEIQKTMAKAIPKAGLEAQILTALGKLADDLLGRSYAREDGASFRIERMLIDAGFQGETVKQWCRTTHHAALVMPSHGHGLTAASKPWSEYDTKRCEKMGTHWMIPKTAAGKKTMRYVSIDTNHWKSFVAARLQQAVGDRGALTLFGKAGQDHRMLADHITAEYWIPTEGRGRKVHEWRLRPGKSENHWWDCLVGAAVAASMQGAAILGGGPPKGKRKLTLEEMARAAEEQKKRQGDKVKR